MVKYQLNCPECGVVHEVDNSQAGESLTCQCSYSVNVPKLTKLRQLPVAETKSSKTSSWNPQQGGVFSAGILVLAIAGCVLGYQTYMWSQIDTTDPFEENLEMFHSFIDSLTYEKAYLQWMNLAIRGLGEQTPSEHMLKVREAEQRLRIMQISGGVVLIGLCITLAAFMLGKKQKPKP